MRGELNDKVPTSLVGDIQAIRGLDPRVPCYRAKQRVPY